MGGVGSSADNALAESFNAALKREVLQDRSSWADATTCRREVFRWLARYNTKRRHSRCRHSSPAAYERTLTTATLPEAAYPTNPVSTTRGQGPCLRRIRHRCLQPQDGGLGGAATPMNTAHAHEDTTDLRGLIPQRRRRPLHL